MSFATWDETYSVKVKSCDEDHQKLFGLLNELHDAMKSGNGAQVIQKVVKELGDYTKYHFSREEALMERAGYPTLGPHRLQHQEFVKKVEEFQNELKSGAAGQAIIVADFLKDWLTKHIKQTDQQYSAHLNAKGVF